LQSVAAPIDPNNNINRPIQARFSAIQHALGRPRHLADTSASSNRIDQYNRKKTHNRHIFSFGQSGAHLKKTGGTSW
jgi:hypothetical protein